MTKHIVLDGWTEWDATAGITNDHGVEVMSTPSDILQIGTHITNQQGDIVWDIKDLTGNDVSSQFMKTDNLDGTFSFFLKFEFTYPQTTVKFIAQNYNLNSNTISVTLQQAT
jgi:hypothetical protein